MMLVTARQIEIDYLLDAAQMIRSRAQVELAATFAEADAVYRAFGCRHLPDLVARDPVPTALEVIGALEDQRIAIEQACTAVTMRLMDRVSDLRKLSEVGDALASDG